MSRPLVRPTDPWQVTGCDIVQVCVKYVTIFELYHWRSNVCIFVFFLFLVSRKRMPLTDWCGRSRFIFEPSDRQNRILEHLIHLGACHCGYFLTLELSPRDHNSISYRATNKNTQKRLLMSRCGEKITTYHFSHRRQLFSRLVFVSCHDRHEILKFFVKILVEIFSVWSWFGFGGPWERVHF